MRAPHIHLVKFGLLLLLLCSCVTARAQRRGISPQLILKRVAQVYAGCASYQDEGVVEVAYHEETGGRIEKIPFKTFFRRPNLFRFEWIEYWSGGAGHKYVVWSNGKETFTYWEPDRFEKDESLGMGVAGAGGVSSGSAHTIPRLLMPETIGGFAITELNDLSLIGVELFEGVSCYRIKGKHPAGDYYEVWIGVRDYLVHKVSTQTKYANYYTVEEEVRRNIKIGAPVAEAVFNFKPPIELSAPEDKRHVAPLTTDENPNWTEFYSPEGRFKVLLPAKPNVQTLTLETARGSIVHHGFTAARIDAVCVVDYADVATSQIMPDDLKTLFDAARDEYLKETQGRLIGETAITLDGNPGREIKIAILDGESRLRLYMVNGRFYQLAFMKPLALDKSTTEMNKFFDSFKLVADVKKIAARGKRDLDVTRR